MRLQRNRTGPDQAPRPGARTVSSALASSRMSRLKAAWRSQPLPHPSLLLVQNSQSTLAARAREYLSYSFFYKEQP